MGDIRFNKQYDAIRSAKDPSAAIRGLSDAGLVEALAGSAQEREPYLSNVLATELANRVRRQAAIIEAAGEGLSALDAEGRVVFLNPAAERMLGRSLRDVRGLPVHEVVHVGASAHSAAEACPLSSVFLPREDGAWHDDAFARPNEHPLPVSWCGAPIVRGSEVEGAVIVFQDIAERVRADEERSKRERALIEQQRALSLLVKSAPARAGEVEAFIQLLVETSARVLDVERVSVWWLEEGPSRIRCADLWETSKAGHSSGLEIFAAAHPEYFGALEDERALAAHDARADVRTRGFGPSYLGPLGITSMLDVPVRSQGEFVGIICHEHVGPKRAWRHDEQTYAAATADLLSTTIEAQEARVAVAETTRQREFLRTVIDNVPQLVYAKDREGRFILANAAVARFFGTASDKLLGMTDDQIVPRAREVPILRTDPRLLETREPLMVPEEPVTSPSTGGTRWFQTINVPLVDADGRARSVLAVATDITERRLLQEDMERYFAAFPALVAMVGLDGLVERLNPTWELHARRPVAEMLGRPFTDLIAPEDRAGAASALARAPNAGLPVPFAARLVTSDEARTTLAWNVTALAQRPCLLIIGSEGLHSPAREGAT